MLPGDFFQRADLFIHLKALRITVVEEIVRQLPQAGGNGLRVPANHRFRVAALHQFLHLFRLMKTDGNMFLKVQSNLESAQQAFVIAALVSRQHMHLLIALGNQIHHLLLAVEQRRQRCVGVRMRGKQTVFGLAVVGQLPVEQA